jgi:hypothetical protein
MNMRCPVCGGELREHVSGCSRCPMNGGCDMLCCENCGYETVAPRSVLVDFVTNLWRKSKAHGGTSRVS